MAPQQEPPLTMRAWTHTSKGPATEVLKLSSNVPFTSTVSPQDVLVSISHVALNPGAQLITTLIPMLFRKPPQIPDMDFSGSIVTIGSSVPSTRHLAPGVKVFGNVPVGQHVRQGKGALAEFVVVPAENVWLKPENLPAEQAAGLLIAGSAALKLVESSEVKEGQRVLVNGASGGVGCFVVQITKNLVGLNGKVVAICSGRNTQLVKGLGADEVIDYQVHSPVHSYLSESYKQAKFDAVIDCFGSQDLWLHCPAYLKVGKPFLTFGVAPPSSNWGPLLWAIAKTLKNLLWPSILGGIDRPYKVIAGVAQLEKLAALTKEGKLRVPIDSTWKFEDALKAYERILSRHASGKVIIEVRSEE